MATPDEAMNRLGNPFTDRISQLQSLLLHLEKCFTDGTAHVHYEWMRQRNASHWRSNHESVSHASVSNAFVSPTRLFPTRRSPTRLSPRLRVSHAPVSHASVSHAFVFPTRLSPTRLSPTPSCLWGLQLRNMPAKHARSRTEPAMSPSPRVSVVQAWAFS